MSAVEKTKSSSVLEEFEIPDTLGGVVEVLRSEQQTLRKEIEEVKAQPVVRKQDESTRVFNLRQHQMELKLQELEEKKKTSEKELQELLQQKNSTLHADLKKLAQFILQESRKLEAKVGNISNIRNELQQIFEVQLNDRKKNEQKIDDQTKLLRDMEKLVSETVKVLQSEFHSVTRDLQKIQVEKAEEQQRLSALRQEVSHHQGLLEEIQSRKKLLGELEEKIAQSSKNALTFAKLDEELGVLRSEIEKLTGDRNAVHQQIERHKHEAAETDGQIQRLKISQMHLEQVASAKKGQLHQIEDEIHDVKKRLESTKTSQQEVHTQYLEQCHQLSVLQTEMARLEGSKTSASVLLTETEKLFADKKAFFQREIDSLEKSHASRMTELESLYQLKKANWDEEFRTYTETQKENFKQELHSLDAKDREAIRKKKSEFMEEMVGVVTAVFGAEGFSSSEERTHKAKKEIELSFQKMFGKTNRWKFW